MSISIILAILVTSITTPKNLEEKVAIDVTKIARIILIDI
jgi:hypothetical protein